MTDFIPKEHYSMIVAVMGLMTTVLIGLFGALWTQRKIKEREIEESHRDKKIKIYQKFVDMYSKMFLGQKQGHKVDEKELLTFLIEFKSDIILWGSSDVINSSFNFEQKSKSGNAKEMFLSMDKLLKSMRKDIGLKNRGLKKYHFVKMFMADPKEFDELIK